MPESDETISMISPQDLQSFRTHLKSSTRILALLGAGLSASSGLPTFRGAGGLWRSYDATALATPGAFKSDPGLVWQFYSYRRNMAKHVQPNEAHLALSALARKLNSGLLKGEEKFLCLTQNVDGLSPRAGHTEQTGLRLLHGSLWDVRCTDRRCGYERKNDFQEPICPALAMPSNDNTDEPDNPPDSLIDKAGKEPDTSSKLKVKASPQLTSHIASLASRGKDIADASIPLSTVPISDLPHCPKCKTHLLRPGVVWFGETLPPTTISSIDSWISSVGKIDLMLVIGTSSVVYPAAGYTDIARQLGARVAVVNLDAGDAKGMRGGDWFFRGDAAIVVPELLKEVIGDD